MRRGGDEMNRGRVRATISLNGLWDILFRELNPGKPWNYSKLAESRVVTAIYAVRRLKSSEIQLRAIPKAAHTL
jgi:hypothetical protein